MNSNKDYDEYLAEEDFDWKDMVMFTLDEALEKMLYDLIKDGSLREVSAKHTMELRRYIEHRARIAIGK